MLKKVKEDCNFKKITLSIFAFLDFWQEEQCINAISNLTFHFIYLDFYWNLNKTKRSKH